VFCLAVLLPSSSEGSSALKLGASSEPPRRCDCTGSDAMPSALNAASEDAVTEPSGHRRTPGDRCRAPKGRSLPTRPRRCEPSLGRSLRDRTEARPKQRTFASPPVHRAAPLLRFRSPTAPSATGVHFSSAALDESARSTAAELPPPQPFRLQGFSPSWRLAPPTASPVCFTRQALMGLPPSRAFSSHTAAPPSGDPCPLGVTTTSGMGRSPSGPCSV
jgi:hypothetical protein